MDVASKQGAAAVAIRRAEPGDVPFISTTWKQHFWKESRWGDRMRWPEFDAGHSRVIAALLGRSQVLVACAEADASEIFGYFVFEPEAKIAHWAYVKPTFRRMGVFSVLLMASDLPPDLDGVRVTHATRSWLSTRPLMAGDRELKPGTVGLDAKFPKAVHDPYSWVGLSDAEPKLQTALAAKDSAYRERNQCVALLAKMAMALGCRVGVAQHPAEDSTWEPDWRTIVYADLPSGQISFHLHDSERHLVEGLPAYPGKWDGHTTEEKYRRCAAFTPQP